MESNLNFARVENGIWLPWLCPSLPLTKLMVPSLSNTLTYMMKNI